MTPTVEIETMTAPSLNVSCEGHIQHCSQLTQGQTHRNSMEVGLPSQDLDNRCSGCLCRRDATPSQRPAIPDASPDFRAAMGRMRSDHTRTTCADSGNTCLDNVARIMSPSSPPPSPPAASSPTSLFNKLKSAFKSTSSTSSQNSPNNSGLKKLTTSGSNKTGNSRRPASFGGADVIKPWTGRRCSQAEKRVSWADELGSNHALISVRFIKPRLSVPSKPGRQSAPAHSILRNTGLH